MDIERLVIADPSGNTTALIFDRTKADDMREVAAIVQDEFPSVEQVLFVQERQGHIHGEMAGGEFCGNAARALGYVLAKGQNMTQYFTMSGLSTPVTVDTGINRAKLEMRTYIKQENRLLHNAWVAVVHLEGISHAVLYPEHPLFLSLRDNAARIDGKSFVKGALDDLYLTCMPACGLLFAETHHNQVSVTPYVFVHNTGTLYAEMSCASGSIAVAQTLNKNASVLQPSGKILDVTIRHEGDFAIASVDGDMNIKWDGAVTDIGSDLPSTRIIKAVNE
jgi:diaminopimelate epimerase